MIPDKPLAINLKSLDADTLTLDSLEILTEPDKFRVSAFKAFMDQYSNWTSAEVGALTVGELRDVSRQIGEALKESATPKAKAPSSKPGRGSRRRSSRPGRPG